jgi:hypothetical protein
MGLLGCNAGPAVKPLGIGGPKSVSFFINSVEK